MKVALFSVVFFLLSVGFSKPLEIKFAKKLVGVGQTQVLVEIADTEEKRQRGLMYRKVLASDSGMLFIFSEEEPRSFWMKNTFIPLEIGFFDRNGKLIDIQEMKPVKSEMEIPKSYASRSPAMFALEVNPGWFKKNNIRVGDLLDLNPDKRSWKIKK